MTYESSVQQLYALGHELASTPSHKFDLAYVREMLSALGNPERRFPSVLIAGTNGKGSTAATLASILRAAGYKTGLYSSPHLVSINERIRVNGEAIADVEFSEIHDRVEQIAQRLLQQGKLPWHPSFFEMLTAMAFEYFASVAVDIAVLEVGMGGRLDATNVVEPVISVIADIALDHQKYLGNTIGEITREKAGIIRANGIVVTLPQHPEANDVIGNAILEKNARGVSATKYVPPVSPGAAEYLSGRVVPTPGRNRYPLTVMGEDILVDSPLPGRHQFRNIALAIAAAEELQAFGFKVTPKQIEQGIRDIPRRIDAGADGGGEVGQRALRRDGVRRIEAQAVEAVFVEPIKRIMGEEIAHFASPERDRRTPRCLRAFVEERLGIAVQVIPVRAEMVIDDIEQHHQPKRVRVVDHRLQLARRAIRLIGRERQHAVIAPVARAGEIGDRHQLDRGHAEVAQPLQPRGDAAESRRAGRHAVRR